jgi:eIF3 subunit 6 N terminal domain
MDGTRVSDSGVARLFVGLARLLRLMPTPCRPSSHRIRVYLAQEQAESIVAFLSDEQLVKQLKQDKAHNLQFLQEQYAIGPPQIDALYHFAKFQFECGNYSVATEFLYHYRSGTPPSYRSSLSIGPLLWDHASSSEHHRMYKLEPARVSEMLLVGIYVGE